MAAAIATNAIVRLPVTLISSSLFGLLQQRRLGIVAHDFQCAGPTPQGRPIPLGSYYGGTCGAWTVSSPLGRGLANAAISCSGRLVGAARLVNDVENIIVGQNG